MTTFATAIAATFVATALQVGNVSPFDVMSVVGFLITLAGTGVLFFHGGKLRTVDYGEALVRVQLKKLTDENEIAEYLLEQEIVAVDGNVDVVDRIGKLTTASLISAAATALLALLSLLGVALTIGGS